VVRVIKEMPTMFTMGMVQAALPRVPVRTIRRALRDLKKRGEVTSHPAGKKSYWEKLDHKEAKEE
jgi:hypothetical protein